MNVSKEMILKAKEIDSGVRNSIIGKIRMIISEVIGFEGVNKRRFWLGLLTNEHFSTFIGNALFWGRMYYCNDMSTPGEEFSMIKLKKGRNMLIYIILLSVKGYLMIKIENAYRRMNEYMIQHHGKAAEFLPLVNLFIPSLETINDIQLVYFLLNNGNYYNLIEKILRMSYVYQGIPTTSDDNSQSFGFLFKGIGYMTLIRLLFRLMRQISSGVGLYKKIRNQRHNEEIYQQNATIVRLGKKNRKDTCLLCLDYYKDVSATFCGHLFCWNCIISYLQDNQHCPTCRQSCTPSQVVYLQNY